MAIFRKIHTSFWSDSFVSELDTESKLFYLYLLSNERTKQCGVYEITKRQISFDLGYSIDRVSILLKYFISKNRIRYNEVTNELAVKNWLKYNSSTSPQVKSCISKEFSQVKDTLLIQYAQSIDTQSQEEQEEEQEEEENKNKIQTKLIFRFLDMGEILVKPSEWLKTYAKLTIENNLIKNKFTPEQMEDIYFKFDLNESDKQFTDANHLKNTFKKFCELRRKELDGVLVSKGGSSKQSASYLQNL